MMIAKICNWQKSFDLTKQNLLATPAMGGAASALIEATADLRPKKNCQLKHPAVEILQAKEALALGELLLDTTEETNSIGFFQHARTADKNLLRAWIQEIKTLRKLGKIEQEQAVEKAYVEANPQLANLPFLRKR